MPMKNNDPISFDSFVLGVDRMRDAMATRGWKVTRTNRNGKFYIKIKFSFPTRPDSPNQVSEMVRVFFPDASLSSYAAITNATYRVNPEQSYAYQHN